MGQSLLDMETGKGKEEFQIFDLCNDVNSVTQKCYLPSGFAN